MRALTRSLLLDLSDRVDPEVSPATPSHRDRDLAAAAAVVEAFVAEMRAKGAFAAEGRIRTLFSPTPADAAVNEVAQGLTTDLGGMSPADKKGVHDGLGAEYQEGLARIYDAVLAERNYVGADIWRFFADGDAANLAVDPDPAVRNVLVVLTDGYAYHEATVHREGNRTSYLTGSLLEGEGLRDVGGWEQRFREGDYGFVDPGVDLPSLEVLVLEVAPSEGHPGDFAVMRAYFGKMFEEMEVARYEVLKTDLPANTRPLIQQFLDGGAAS
ncbi:MAG TPA: hypothetical protein EYG39_11745 [Rhodothermales bacterium]|nr:hypothetical protein [Rhodothermales bacterium]